MRVSLDVHEIDILLQITKIQTFKGEDAPKVAKLLLKLQSALEKGMMELEKQNGGIIVPDGEVPMLREQEGK
tara:strand:+ start:336 stop:551 length:216 start_codon:yes stop_codon:yes gene_type:complete